LLRSRFLRATCLQSMQGSRSEGNAVGTPIIKSSDGVSKGEQKEPKVTSLFLLQEGQGGSVKEFIERHTKGGAIGDTRKGKWKIQPMCSDNNLTINGREGAGTPVSTMRIFESKKKESHRPGKRKAGWSQLKRIPKQG